MDCNWFGLLHFHLWNGRFRMIWRLKAPFKFEFFNLPTVRFFSILIFVAETKTFWWGTVAGGYQIHFEYIVDFCALPIGEIGHEPIRWIVKPFVRLKMVRFAHRIGKVFHFVASQCTETTFLQCVWIKCFELGNIYVCKSNRDFFPNA